MHYVPTAAEDVTVRAGFVPASTPEARIPALLATAGRVDANRRPPRTMSGKATGSAQVFAVVLSAVMNPARAALFTSPAATPAPAETGKAKTGRKAGPTPKQKKGK